MSNPAIVLTGIDASTFTPGNFLELNFAKGQASGFQGIYAALLIANRTTAGTGTLDTKVYGPDTDVPCATEDDIISLGGAGSEAHRGWKRFVKANPKTPLYVLFVTESVGAAATLAITFATTAGANGFARVWCCDEYVDVPISSGDTVTAIAGNVKTKVNAQLSWPVTGDNSAGVFTFTAKQLGLRGNDIPVQINIFSTGAIATTATGAVAATVLSGGTTADSNTNALATILAKRFYYVISAANDATQFGALKTQMNTQALPATGITQRGLCGYRGTLSNCITLATTVNAARTEIPWQKSSDITPFEIACQAGAAYALYEAGKRPRPRHNFNGFGNSEETSVVWTLPAPRAGTAPTPTEIESALHNGITPIGANQNGSSYLVKRITTRSLNGSTADYRIRDAHKVTVLDFFADDAKVAMGTAFEAKDIGDDPLPGAAPSAGDAQSNPDVVTPRVFKALLFDQLDLANGNGQLQNVAAIKAGTIVQRETNPSTRMSARVPMQTIDVFDQAAVAVDQVK